MLTYEDMEYLTDMQAWTSHTEYCTHHAV